MGVRMAISDTIFVHLVRLLFPPSLALSSRCVVFVDHTVSRVLESDCMATVLHIEVRTRFVLSLFRVRVRAVVKVRVRVRVRVRVTVRTRVRV